MMTLVKFLINTNHTGLASGTVKYHHMTGCNHITGWSCKVSVLKKMRTRGRSYFSAKHIWLGFIPSLNSKYRMGCFISLVFFSVGFLWTNDIFFTPLVVSLSSNVNWGMVSSTSIFDESGAGAGSSIGFDSSAINLVSASLGASLVLSALVIFLPSIWGSPSCNCLKKILFFHLAPATNLVTCVAFRFARSAGVVLEVWYLQLFLRISLRELIQVFQSAGLLDCTSEGVPTVK